MEDVYENKMLLLSSVGAIAMLLLTFTPHYCVTLAAAGPWGGSGGTAFYDGTASAISAIQLRHGETIYSLRTQYVIGGTLHWSQTHGGSDGELIKINLNYEEEYISEIKGFYGDGILSCQCPTVNSIAFKVVNAKTGVARTMGPYGKQEGTEFKSPAGAKIVGFYGRAGSTVDQLGVYILCLIQEVCTFH
eukprot:Gb_24218 [translate_table: standard]